MKKKYSFNSDGKVFVNDIPLEPIEEAIRLLQKAGLDTTSTTEALSLILPNDEKAGKLLFTCAACCAAGVLSCRHKGCHTHPNDCKKL